MPTEFACIVTNLQLLFVFCSSCLFTHVQRRNTLRRYWTSWTHRGNCFGMSPEDLLPLVFHKLCSDVHSVGLIALSLWVWVCWHVMWLGSRLFLASCGYFSTNRPQNIIRYLKLKNQGVTNPASDSEKGVSSRGFLNLLTASSPGQKCWTLCSVAVCHITTSTVIPVSICMWWCNLNYLSESCMSRRVNNHLKSDLLKT